MKFSAILLVCALVSTQGSHGKRGFTCKDGVHKSICLPENYSKFELPFTEKTNQIGISIDIDDVLRINDAGELEIKFYFQGVACLYLPLFLIAYFVTIAC